MSNFLKTGEKIISRFSAPGEALGKMASGVIKNPKAHI